MRTRKRLSLSSSLPAFAFVILSALTGFDRGVSQELGGAAPRFLDGQAQVVPAFQDSSQWIREQLWVETEFDTDGDGKLDRIHVAVVRPGQTETEGLKVPAIYESSPYFSGTAPPTLAYFWDVRQEVGGPPPPRAAAPSVQARTRPEISNSQVNTWVPRGFAVVHSEAPGTGLSEGCPTVGGPPEALAPKAVIDWLNGRARGFTSVDGGEEVEASWSTGRVGMTGTSYNGTIPVAAATTGVEGLEAIIPIAPNTSYYRYYRSNGLVRSPGGWLGEDIDVLYDFINSGDPEGRAYCNATFRDGEMAAGQDRVTGDYNDFWASRDFMNELDGIRAATLMAHAFNDWNVMPEHSVKVYEHLKARGVPVQAYFHQGGHGGAPPLELMNRWFTRYLYGVENGVENDPRAWIVREGDERGDPTPYPDYPNPDAAPVTLFPTAGGVQRGGLGMEKSPGQGTETLVDNFSFSGAILARAEWTNHRLLYATPELEEPIHLSGTPRISLRLASSMPAANLSVWLVSLPWAEGRVSRGGLVTRGWADPQNHESLTRSDPLVPGRFYDLTFELQPDDQIIPEGQRLGLMIFSSDRDFTLRPPPGTELTVDLDATSLELPVVGGPDAWERAMGGAGQADPDDVRTLDGILRAYYEVVSGPAGESSDRARDKTLHVPDAVVGIPDQDEDGDTSLLTMTLDEYHDRLGGPRSQGFYEREIHRIVHRFGTVAQVLSTYATSTTPGGEPFERGINSIQLTWDGTRWWIVSWVYDSERPENPIPTDYLPG